MSTETNRLDITGVDLKKFVREVYALSRPQGMGFIHYKEGPLPEGAAEEVLKRSDDYIAVRMDYVIGRACKMTVWNKDGKLVINPRWFDHTADDLRELLRRIGRADLTDQVEA